MPLRLTTAILESLLAIPILGGSIIVSLVWTPLLVMLVLHIITLVMSVRERTSIYGNIVGIVASVLGIIPFLGMALHILAAILLWIAFSIDLGRAKREDAISVAMFAGIVIPAVGVSFLAFLVGIAIIGNSSSQQNRTVRLADSVPIQNSQLPNIPRTISGISFFEIRDNMLSDAMTEAQYNAYLNSLNGSWIRWSGYIEEVNEKTFGGYEVWIDMDEPSEMFSVQDIMFDIPDSIALLLNKDQRVTFEGEIDSAMNVRQNVDFTPLKSAKMCTGHRGFSLQLLVLVNLNIQETRDVLLVYARRSGIVNKKGAGQQP